MPERLPKPAAKKKILLYFFCPMGAEALRAETRKSASRYVPDRS